MAELTGPTAQAPSFSVGDAFGWVARDPEWISKVLLMGLIGLIPIVGALQQYGWLLTMLDNLRLGRYEVPPAGFRYATRGVWLWLAVLIYTLVFVFIFYGVFIVLGLGIAASTNGDHTSPLVLVFFPLLFIWSGVLLLVLLVIWLFVPALIELTDRKGLAGAFDIAAIVHAVRADPQHNLAAAGLALAAYFIAGLGVYLCWVGVIFTGPYGVTVLAGVLHWYEAGLKPGALPAPPPPSTAALAR